MTLAMFPMCLKHRRPGGPRRLFLRWSAVSNAAKGHGNVKSLVYVAAFAPDASQAAAMPLGLPSQILGDGHGGFATKGVDQDDQALSAAFTCSGRNG